MHYNDSYYKDVYAGFDDNVFARKWALACALAAGYANKKCFHVLEFGAGLGQNLDIINASHKWAVDISEASKISCTEKGFNWSNSLDHVPNGIFDTIISRHSLEHVPDPKNSLEKLLTKISTTGELYLIVPFEKSSEITSLTDFDSHKHLFSWTPETIKNLLLETGWSPLSIKVHNSRMLRRFLWLLPRHRGLFLRARKIIELITPHASPEIIICATPMVPRKNQNHTSNQTEKSD